MRQSCDRIVAATSCLFYYVATTLLSWQSVIQHWRHDLKVVPYMVCDASIAPEGV